MRIYIKGENEDGEIEFSHTDGGGLFVSILNGHGTTYYEMEKEEVEALVSFIKLSNEWLD
jgi:hypothetical protein